MILVASVLMAAVGSAGVLIITLIGWLLTRWLGRGAALGTALLLGLAILADLAYIATMLRDARNADETAVAQILAIGCAVPILIALPCALLFARSGWKG